MPTGNKDNKAAEIDRLKAHIELTRRIENQKEYAFQNPSTVVEFLLAGEMLNPNPDDTQFRDALERFVGIYPDSVKAVEQAYTLPARLPASILKKIKVEPDPTGKGSEPGSPTMRLSRDRIEEYLQVPEWIRKLDPKDILTATGPKAYKENPIAYRALKGLLDGTITQDDLK